MIKPTQAFLAVQKESGERMDACEDALTAALIEHGRTVSPISRFNSLGNEAAEATLLTCCGSRAWARAVTAARPYPTAEALLQQASGAWFALPEPDWLDAFAHHPRIGERKHATTGFLTQSATEQSTTQQTLAADVAAQLLEGNQAYEATFGFIYLVFASGRTAPELLEVLTQRLQNTRPQELQEAARQQDRITRLRLERYLTS